MYCKLIVNRVRCKIDSLSFVRTPYGVTKVDPIFILMTVEMPHEVSNLVQCALIERRVGKTRFTWSRNITSTRGVVYQ